MLQTESSVRAEIDIHARPMAITHALTDVAQLKQWWNVDQRLVDERADGVWAVRWNAPDADCDGAVLSGTIRSLRHSSHLHLQRMVYVSPGRPILGPLSLTFEVREQGTSTRLTMLHEGFGNTPDLAWYREISAASWPRDLVRLKDHLERPR